MSSLLKRDPEERLFLEEVLQHPFCAGVVSEQAKAEAESAFQNFDRALSALDALEDDDD